MGSQVEFGRRFGPKSGDHARGLEGVLEVLERMEHQLKGHHRTIREAKPL